MNLLRFVKAWGMPFLSIWLRSNCKICLAGFGAKTFNWGDLQHLHTLRLNLQWLTQSNVAFRHTSSAFTSVKLPFLFYQTHPLISKIGLV